LFTAQTDIEKSLLEHARLRFGETIIGRYRAGGGWCPVIAALGIREAGFAASSWLTSCCLFELTCALITTSSTETESACVA
jgi:hypothetical protein